jgi:hypothetical protein
MLIDHIRDAVITLPNNPGTEVTNIDVESERGVVYFDYVKIRFRVTDRYEVEEQGPGQYGYALGAASLLLESLLRHRGELCHMAREHGVTLLPRR